MMSLAWASPPFSSWQFAKQLGCQQGAPSLGALKKSDAHSQRSGLVTKRAELVTVWLGRGDHDLDASQLTGALDRVAKLMTERTQLVVVMHGYEMGREQSDRMFCDLTKELERAATFGSFVVLGLQWDSGGSLLGTDYLAMVTRARTLGRGPVRELLGRFQQEHAEVPVSIFAHSLGCEMAMAAIVPDLSYNGFGPQVEVTRPGQVIEVQMAALLGSDLDYDIWYQEAPEASKWFDRCKLTWLTVSDPTAVGDRVLSLRSRLRGPAMGALIPRLTVKDWDRVLATGGLYVDSLAIPFDHEFNHYFTSDRVGRLVPVLEYLGYRGSESSEHDAAACPAELEAMHRVRVAPNRVDTLASFLVSPYGGAALTALWRLEHLHCEGALHLSDQTLERPLRLLRDEPQRIWSLQVQSSCQTLRQGLFPTEQTMGRAGAPSWARPKRYRLSDP